jgi:hypothetical protein
LAASYWQSNLGEMWRSEREASGYFFNKLNWAGQKNLFLLDIFHFSGFGCREF